MTSPEQMSLITGTQLPFPNASQQTGYISTTATVEPNTTVDAGSNVRGWATINSHAKVVGQSTVGEHSFVGDFAYISNRSLVSGMAVIRDYAHLDAAEVVGNALVMGWARLANDDSDLVVRHGIVRGMADIADSRHVLNIGPVGSENRTVTVHRAYQPGRDTWGALINAGCFTGTINRLEERLNKDHAWGNSPDKKVWDDDYRAVLKLAKARLRQWREESQPTEGTKTWWAERIERLGIKHSVSDFWHTAMHADGSTEW